MVPDCEGWWWYKPLGWVYWKPEKVFPVGSDLKFKSNSFTILKVADAPGQWGERLYTPDQYPRYLKIAGGSVVETIPLPYSNGRTNVDYDKDGCALGIEILHPEAGQ